MSAGDFAGTGGCLRTLDLQLVFHFVCPGGSLVSLRRASLALAVILLGLAYFAGRPQEVSGDEWQPIPPDELKMTSVPEAPGAPAVILYRQVDRDDNSRTGNEYNYVRIKILTEEGRKHADVEIPYFRDQSTISSVRARTVRPDGTVANFEGKAYDKTIAKAKGVKYLAKTFTLPDVQVGSIIEYHYTYNLQENYVYDSNWILSDELFTRHAKFSLRPNAHFALRWSWPIGLPVGTEPPKQEPSTKILRMESQNIPAFQVEDYMPPQNQLKFRVNFHYSDEEFQTDADKFWKEHGKKLNGKVESFTGKGKGMDQALAQIVAQGDAPEVKAQKIYARVQQLRNTSFEVHKSEEELKRDKTKEAKNVEDVWRAQTGDGAQLTWLYLALVKAAGIEAYPVDVASRSEYIFQPKMMNDKELNTNVVMLKINGKPVYCDPGTAFVPYGLLPWNETGVIGLKLDKDGGSWVETTIPQSSQSRVMRKADMKLGEDGTLSGKVMVTYTGLEALTHRLEMRNEDDAARKSYMEDLLKEYVPVGVEVELKNQPEWKSSSPTLTAEYELKVPGWASAAGKRALVPTGLFSATEKQVFEHSSRVYPICFHFPFEKDDDITVQLPLGWQVSAVPKPRVSDQQAAVYTLKVEDEKGTLHVVRTLKNDLVVLDPKQYPSLRGFYQTVKSGDEEQVMVQPGAAVATH
jgi:hypothetical protein